MAELIAKDLWRLNIPLRGNPLKNLNSYLIVGERSLLIDTGFNWDSCLKAMERELAETGVDRGRMDIFVTHLHSDHSGLVAKLIRPGCKAYISSIDGGGIIVRGDPAWHHWYEKYICEGFSQAEIDEVKGLAPSQSGSPSKLVSMDYVEDGDVLRYGTHELRCLLTPGHTPGHMCLYDAENKWLFSGDHILFSITPNICRWKIRKDSLGDYMDSLRKVRDLPVELLLPGHREQTGVLSQRVDELLMHHKVRLANTIEVLDAMPGANACQIAGEMKWKISARNWSEFPLTQKLFAVGETDAHLDYLLVRGKARTEQKDGVNVFYPA